MSLNMKQCPLVSAKEFTDDRFDSIVVVTDSSAKLTGALADLKPVIEDYIKV